MRHYVVTPVIGGLVAIILAGVATHEGTLSFGTRSASYQSSCHLGAVSAAVSPAVMSVLIRDNVHC